MIIMMIINTLTLHVQYSDTRFCCIHEIIRLKLTIVEQIVFFFFALIHTEGLWKFVFGGSRICSYTD